MLGLFLSACAREGPGFSYADLPEGNAESGAELFTQEFEGAQGCYICHDTGQTRLIGPPLAGYAERAGDEVDGESAEVYTFNSIVAPTQHIVSSYSNAMPRNYAEVLTQQQIADLIAYLLTL